jgi:hypothetical protein
VRGQAGAWHRRQAQRAFGGSSINVVGDLVVHAER